MASTLRAEPLEQWVGEVLGPGGGAGGLGWGSRRCWPLDQS